MNAAPVALPSLRLRVRMCAADPAAAARLALLVAESGHLAVGAGEPADAVLTDGSAELPRGLPCVALGAEAGEIAGILPDDAGPEQLDAALRAVAAGLSVRPVLPGGPPPGFAALPEALSPALTPREIEVLTAIADGLGNKAAARRLGISPHTIKFHIESLLRKLGAATRAEAVAKGLRRQLVEF
jgi:DNA-binding CsgD family transcriptional regulator